MPKITTNSDPQKKSYTFVRVGENLYRVKETGGYYALVKRNRKQIRRSLKTTDKALAKRRLNVLLRKLISSWWIQKSQTSLFFAWALNHP